MRGGVDFEGIDYRAATFKASGGLVSAVMQARSFDNDGRDAVVGKAVTITGDGEVGFGSKGDPLLGKVVQFEFDEHVTVQYGGYARLPIEEGATPTAGDKLVVDGTGSVTPSAGAVAYARAVTVDGDDNSVIVLLG